MTGIWIKRYHALPEPFRRYIKSALNTVSSVFFGVKCGVNSLFLKNYLVAKYRKLHLGCGDVRLGNCVNIDFRATKAADLVMDLNNLGSFKEGTIETVYSHAFFEHIYRPKRSFLLKDIKRILTRNGLVVFLGIPDFERIARAYLNKEQGIIGAKFDLFNVYRYTHGDPEQYPGWWFEQLHKSLFDKEEIVSLLDGAGYPHYTVFRYIFDKEKVPVSLGFIAGNQTFDSRLWGNEIYERILPFNVQINKKSIEILSIK